MFYFFVEKAVSSSSLNGVGPILFSFQFPKAPDFSVPLCWRPFFRLEQSVPGLDHFPFPDMREFDEQTADEIREETEMAVCFHCAAVLLRGISHLFYCQPFTDIIRDHLLPPTE
jgi:hypothetical protein